LSLRKALSERNITSGFLATGIFPFNKHAVDEYLDVSWTCTNGGRGIRAGEFGCTGQDLEPEHAEAPSMAHE
jgi:hypothetical protein